MTTPFARTPDSITQRREDSLAMMRVGDELRRLREKRGITLRQLGEKVGLSAPFLSDVEHGRRRLSRLDAVAKASGELGAKLLEGGARARDIQTALKDLGLSSGVAFEGPVQAMNDIAAVGLLKMDLLGLRTLTIISDAAALVPVGGKRTTPTPKGAADMNDFDGAFAEASAAA